MTRRSFFGALLIGAVTRTSAFTAANITGGKAGKSLPKDKGKIEQIIVYYFHGKIRCEICKQTEKQSHDVIKQRFSAEIESKRMMFKSVNYDEPTNAHFLKDYKLTCPSLVVVRQMSGKDVKWKLLGDTWEYFGDLQKFNEYVVGEVVKFVGEKK